MIYRENPQHGAETDPKKVKTDVVLEKLREMDNKISSMRFCFFTLAICQTATVIEDILIKRRISNIYDEIQLIMQAMNSFIDLFYHLIGIL